MKTCIYKFDPIKPHFYIVNWDIHYFSYFVEAVLTSTHNLCFEQKYEKNQNFLSENFHFLVIKFSVYLFRLVFAMVIGNTIIRWMIQIFTVHIFLEDMFSYGTTHIYPRSLLSA